MRENWDFVKIVGQLKIPMGTFVGGKKKCIFKKFLQMTDEGIKKSQNLL